MTTRKHQCLTFVIDYIATHGYSPTQAEIATGIGSYIAHVWHWLEELEADGYISRKPRRWRSIVVLRVPEGRAA